VRAGLAKPQDSPFRYQGQYEDVETGLYYNRFRYFDPETGQYISQDPIGLRGGMNLYNYVTSPTISIDPYGLSDSPILVLGENQKAVDETARILRRNGYPKAESMAVPKLQWDVGKLPFDTPEKLEKAVNFNRQWINQKMDEGYKIVTIGPDGRNSVFYQAELEEIAKRGYTKTTLRKLPTGETITELRTRLCPLR
jgi:RHS repeat-associated protein